MWEVFSKNRKTGAESCVVTHDNKGAPLTRERAASFASRCSYADTRNDVSYDIRETKKR